MENGNYKLPFVCCKWKQKTEVCFSLLANDKQYSIIAVSTNVLIYVMLPIVMTVPDEEDRDC
jgi:hypothetical protein